MSRYCRDRTIEKMSALKPQKSHLCREPIEKPRRQQIQHRTKYLGFDFLVSPKFKLEKCEKSAFRCAYLRRRLGSVCSHYFPLCVRSNLRYLARVCGNLFYVLLRADEKLCRFLFRVSECLRRALCLVRVCCRVQFSRSFFRLNSRFKLLQRPSESISEKQSVKEKQT